ncbi:MAG: DNA cytosine methyltransferase [Bryobacteraceae bacterium]
MKPGLASFFSGIGGVDLGFANVGFRLTVQCELDKFCRSVLKAHWPKLPRFNDIKEMTDADVPVSDVWAGGFPCQDVSLARMGPRAGLKGKRSGLFFEFARLLERGRPRVFIIENVPGLLSSHGGRDFEIILRTLADLGYGVGWRVLNSRYFGVPQSRQRVYIVGCHRDPRGPGQILFESECGQRHPTSSGSNGTKPISPFKESIGDPLKGPITPSLAYCLYACSARHTGTDWSRNYVSYPDGRVRRLMPIECERLQGFPEGWTIPEKLDITDPDKVDTLRYHALGNAVTVPVAQWLAERIKTYLAIADNASKAAAGKLNGHATQESYRLLSRSRVR